MAKLDRIRKQSIRTGAQFLGLPPSSASGNRGENLPGNPGSITKR